ncbi:MAG: hypothetical protein CM15mP66_12060 [Pseudomonadota bacterium]|nr:MAG: hypothetical protein CM15mP66_12060 [Pseudomonadota bacterium]
MPIMNGFEFLEKFRNDLQSPIPVIVITSADLTDEEKQISFREVVRVLQKSDVGNSEIINEIKDFSTVQLNHHDKNSLRRGQRRQHLHADRRLKKKGFEIVIANDGREGVSKAKTEKPDLILMDLSLPELDGWEATRLIKADQKPARFQ